MSKIKSVALSDERYFEIGIGKRVLKKNVMDDPTDTCTIPLYSSNTTKIFGYVSNSNLYADCISHKKFEYDHVLWGIDGDLKFNVIKRKKPFATTDHCGVIKILSKDISAEYVRLVLEAKTFKLGFDRTNRASLNNVRDVKLEIPVDDIDKFDLMVQKNTVKQYEPIRDFKKNIVDIKKEIQNKKIKFISDYEYTTKYLSDIFDIKKGNTKYTKKYVLTNNYLGDVPIYSSNTKNGGILTKIRKDAIEEDDLYHQHCLTMTSDGVNAGTLCIRNDDNIKNIKDEQYYFTMSSHCIILIPLHDKLYLPFFIHKLQTLLYTTAIGYGNNRVGINQIKKLSITIPITKKSDYDLDAQKEISSKYDDVESLKISFCDILESICKKNIIVM